MLVLNSSQFGLKTEVAPISLFLRYDHRRPSPSARWQDRGWFGLGPLESHNNMSGPYRAVLRKRGSRLASLSAPGDLFWLYSVNEPSAFFFMPGGIGELIGLAVDRILDQQLGHAV